MIEMYPQSLQNTDYINENIEIFKEYIQKKEFRWQTPIKELEEKISEITDFKYSLFLNCATTALILGMRSLNIKEGSEVLVTTMTYQATISCIVENNLVPVFVDINEKTLQIDEKDLMSKITDKTKAFIVVHLNGDICDISDKVLKKMKEKNIYIIEDAAQVFPYKSRIKDNTFSVLSTGPTKNLMGISESGFLLTNDEEIYNIVTVLKNNGNKGGFQYIKGGINGKPDSFAALNLINNLKYVTKWISKRQEISKIYDEELNISNIEILEKGLDSTHCKYSILVKDRDKLKEFLNTCGIETDIYYPIPLNMQFGKQRCDIAEKICKHIISLPIHHNLDIKNVKYICNEIRRFYE